MYGNTYICVSMNTEPTYEELDQKFDDLIVAIRDLDDLCGHNIEHIQDFDLDDGEGPDRFESRFQRITELAKSHAILKQKQEQIYAIKDEISAVADVLGVYDGDQSYRGSEGRVIRVKLTSSMIRNSMLTLTDAKKQGIVSVGERFELHFPHGSTVNTDLVLTGNRLRERKAFRVLYEAEKAKSSDVIVLKERKEDPGTWDLSCDEFAQYEIGDDLGI